MITQTFYAIQHIPSGICLPERGSRKGRKGYTHDEPNSSQPPRMFKHHRYALSALKWWLKGEASVEWEQDPLEGDWDIKEIVSTPVEGRKEEDMRIVEIKVLIPEPFREKFCGIYS